MVTNRVVLDSQLQDTINSFEHQVGLVEAIDDKKNSRSLAEAINDKKRIIICTIQKFLFAKKDMEKFRGRKFAIIIDEAHQEQNGESAKSLRRSLIDLGVAIKEYAEEAGIEEEEVDLTDEYINAVIGQGRHDNQSFFAFTATPKGQTLESFGTVVGMTLEGEPIKAPFHVYSMRQAIEEGYILDVLANYTTVKEAFRLIRVSEDNLKCFALNERCTQVDGYPVRRGMCFPIDKNTMYLFTHGIAPSVISPKRRYFQGGKSVPLPLKVVKHYGSGDMAQIATEILGLSKMNWNSFGLYSKLPCTIESSNEIARIGWLLSQFEGTLYDYRYFM